MGRSLLWLFAIGGAALLGCTGDDGPFGAGATTTATGGAATGGAAGAAGAGGNGGQGGQPATGGAGGAGGAAPITDFFEPGPYSVTAADGEYPSPGCGILDDTLNYTLYTPDGGSAAPLVVLGHGFGRGRDNMVEMAEHMASYGVRVVTPDYCALSIGDTDYPRNATDQVGLAAAVAGGAPVIHAGYSAGGSVAIMATAADSTATALLALDAVNGPQGEGAAAAPGIAVPTFGIDGEPSSCNQNNNGGTHLAKLVPGGTAARAVGATHCDFEGPTNWLCTSTCGGEGQDGQRPLIRALATAFVAWRSGVDPSGEDWVTTAGGNYQRLELDGDISTL
jgi:hypothetical protein